MPSYAAVRSVLLAPAPSSLPQLMSMQRVAKAPRRTALVGLLRVEEGTPPLHINLISSLLGCKKSWRLSLAAAGPPGIMTLREQGWYPLFRGWEGFPVRDCSRLGGGLGALPGAALGGVVRRFDENLNRIPAIPERYVCFYTGQLPGHQNLSEGSVFLVLFVLKSGEERGCVFLSLLVAGR